MKEYIEPKFEIEKYLTSDCLTDSDFITNGNDNVEVNNAGQWQDNII